MATYIDTDEISVFGVVIRIDGTLCGFAPKTKRWAPVGGGLEAHHNLNIFKALADEITQEAGAALQLVLASPNPVMFYTDAIAKTPLKKPKPGRPVKLHIYLLFHEVSQGQPHDGCPDEIRDMAFRPTGFFEADLARRKSKLLRPSFHYALQQFQKQGVWPMCACPKEAVQLDGSLLMERLYAMRFNPRKAFGLAYAVHGQTYSA